MRYLMLLTVVVFTAALHAGYEATITGRIVAAGSENGIAGVEVKAEVDNNWAEGARMSRTLPEHFESAGGAPVVSGTGSATTDASGNFRMTFRVSVDDMEKLPRRDVNLGGSSVSLPFTIVRLTGAVPGKRPVARLVQATDGMPAEVPAIEMSDEYSFEATVVHLADRRPVAGVKVVVRGGNWDSYMSENVTREIVVETDSNGRLHLNDAQCPDRFMYLRMAEPGLAFSTTSSAWRPTVLKPGRNDGGTLVAVPGGGLRVSAEHADTGEAMRLRFQVTGNQLVEPRPPHGAGNIPAYEIDGETVMNGFPVGTYQATATPFRGTGAMWPYHFGDVTIEAGKITDLGTARMEPQRSLTLRVRGDTNEGIERFVVAVEQVSGFRPHPARGDHQPWVEHYRLTAENSTVQRLASGTWRLTVDADGYAVRTLEVTLPEDEVFEVVLERGGEVVLNVEGEEWRLQQGIVLLVPHTAPSYASIAGLSVDEVFEAYVTGLDRTDVVIIGGGGAGSHNIRRRLQAMTPGSYTAFLTAHYEYFRVENVMIQKGEVTTVNFTRQASHLTLVVEHKGQPMADELVYLVPVRHSQVQLEGVRSVVTSDDGAADFGNIAGGTYIVRSSHAHRRLANQSQVQRLSGDGSHLLHLAHGESVMRDVGIYSPDHVWLNVEVNAPPDAGFIQMRIEHLDHDIHNHPVTSRDGTFVLGLVPMGSLEILLSSNVREMECGVSRILEIEGDPVQTRQIEFELHDLTIRARTPRGVDDNRFRLSLLHAPDQQWKQRISTQSGVFSRRFINGSVELKNIPTGTYWVRLWEDRSNDPRASSGFSSFHKIEVARSQSITLRPDVRSGTLSLRFSGGLPTDRVSGRTTAFRAELFDRQGQPVETTYPDDVRFRNFMLPMQYTIRGVPPGTYTLRFSGTYIQTVEVGNIVIRAGENTITTVEVERLMGLGTQVNGIDEQTFRDSNPRIEVLDADGNVMDIQTATDPTWTFHRPDQHDLHRHQHRTYNFESPPRPPSIHIVVLIIPGEWGSIRILLDGYQPIIIKNSPGHRSETPTAVPE
jgi:hypothetical protein